MQIFPIRHKSRRLLMVLALLAQLGLPAPDAGAATEDSPELLTGISLLKRQAYNVASMMLRAAVERSPEDPRPAFYLGVALSHTTGGKEAESLLKRGLAENPESPEVNFELGLHYFDKEILAEASDYFEQVILLAPGSDYAEEAREYLKDIEGQVRDKAWEITLLTGMQYDSNVILTNGSMPLPAGYANKGDWSGVANLKVSYVPVRSDAFELTTGFSLYQNLHPSLTDFNITQGLAEVSASYTLLPQIKAKGNYSFEYLLLGGERYDNAHTLSPSLSHISRSWGTTTLDYHYSSKNYWNSDKFGNNSLRNGNNQLIGMSHLLPVNQATSLWMLYSYDADTTRDAALGYQGNRALIGGRRQLPFGLVGDFSGELYLRRYGVSELSFGFRRLDTQATFSLSIVKNISEHLSLSLGEVVSRNWSNIEAFSYTRAITSALVSARF
jgi:tetratricopeptide (TPR) repeat protein